jgi:3-hydroxyacyl-CoA dehydrogenase
MKEQHARDSLRGIHYHEGYGALRNVELVVESIAERLNGKQRLFGLKEGIVPKDATLASSTSSLKLDEVFAFVVHNARTVGMHFFNPADMIPLEELGSTGKHREDRRVTAPRTGEMAFRLWVNGPLFC